MTGSLVNNMYAGMQGTPAPAVGLGATRMSYTDRDAYTIISVAPNGKSFDMQLDHAERTDKRGMSDAQDYKYTPNVNGIIEHVKLRLLRGQYRWYTYNMSTTDKGRPCTNWGSPVVVGIKDKYYDYSF
jgi:hypothetical protein